MEKKTDRDYFNQIITDYTAKGDTDAVAWATKKIAQIDHRNEKARERAAEKASENDAITEAIYNVLTDRPATIQNILAALSDETLTPNKISARLGKLVKQGRVTKSEVIVDNGEGKKASRKQAYTKVEG